MVVEVALFLVQVALVLVQEETLVLLLHSAAAAAVAGPRSVVCSFAVAASPVVVVSHPMQSWQNLFSKIKL